MRDMKKELLMAAHDFLDQLRDAKTVEDPMRIQINYNGSYCDAFTLLNDLEYELRIGKFADEQG